MNHTDFAISRLSETEGSAKRKPHMRSFFRSTEFPNVANEKYYSPKEVAGALGVSESSIKRWCDSGRIPNTKTTGGHRRMTTTNLIEFLRKKKRQVEMPEIVGLPALSLPTASPAIIEMMSEAAVAQKVSVCRDIILQLYLDQWPIHKIFDEVIVPAADCYQRSGLDSQRIKELSYDIHCLASETCKEAIYQFWCILPPASVGQLMAVGINCGHEPESLWSLGTQIVLAELGCQFPQEEIGSMDQLFQVSLTQNPGLVWASLPSIPSQSELLRLRDSMNRIARHLSAGVPVLVSATPLPAEFIDGLESVSVSYSLTRLCNAIKKQFVL